MPIATSLYYFCRELLRDAIRVCMELFKVMIPVIVGVKILQELDIIGYLSLPLKPLMSLVGLPAEMGLAWATALLNNIYSGIVVFLSLIGDTPVSAAQVTVLGTMFLMAHGLPVELSIVRKSGPRMIFQALSRVGGALVVGFSLNWAYTYFNVLQEPANVLLKPEAKADPTLLMWAFGEAKNLFYIFLIIIALLLVMKLLTVLRITELMNWLLRPILRLIGIGKEASTITVIGLTLGLSYGGGLIIDQAKRGLVDRRDVFYSLTLMGVAHSLIEDTLLMIMIGGQLSGLIWTRLAYSLLFVALLVRVTKIMPEGFKNRFLWGPPKDEKA